MSKAWQYKHVREYLALLRRADQALAKGCRIRLRWNGDAMDVEEWRDERIKALDKRITLKSGKPVGRKHSEQYQIGLFRDCHRERDAVRRIRVYQFETPEITRRYKHLLAVRGEIT